MNHVDYPHNPGTLWDCAACEPILSAISLAEAYQIDLEPKDFELVDGEWTIDGMDPHEWIWAMASE